jgi:hypothetical protein
MPDQGVIDLFQQQQEPTPTNFQREDVMKASPKLAALAMCLSTFVAGSAFAADITVGITGGPLPEVVGALSKAFESATGNKVTLKPVAANQVAALIKDGAFDALVTDEDAVNPRQGRRFVERQQDHAVQGRACGKGGRPKAEDRDRG